ETLRAAVRNAGLRATPSRIAVLHLLRSAGSPVSHGDVVAKLASQAWDPATIYRNLTALSDVGLARRADLGDRGCRYVALHARPTSGGRGGPTCATTSGARRRCRATGPSCSLTAWPATAGAGGACPPTPTSRPRTPAVGQSASPG